MIYAAMPRMIYSLREYDIHPLRVCMIYYPRLAVADNIEKSTAFAVLFSGATTGIRTRDLVITNDVLCQLSHSSALSIVIISNKVPFVNSFFALTENRAAAALPQGKPQNACHFRRRFIRLRKTSFCYAQNDKRARSLLPREALVRANISLPLGEGGPRRGPQKSQEDFRGSRVRGG